MFGFGTQPILKVDFRNVTKSYNIQLPKRSLWSYIIKALPAKYTQRYAVLFRADHITCPCSINTIHLQFTLVASSINTVKP